MNAPHRFPAALHRTPTANGETVTAADGLAERSAAEYREAAAAARARHNTAEARALDERASEIEADGLADPDELHEAAREEALAEFEDWRRADYERREFEDFGNWLANKARWNRPNRYEVALTAAEGGARMTRAELVALSVNQRKFGRENRSGGALTGPGCDPFGAQPCGLRAEHRIPTASGEL